MAEESSEDEQSLLEIEVFRKQPPVPRYSNSDSPVSVSSCYSSRARRNHKKANSRRGSVVNHSNGCSHSTPLLGSTDETRLLKEYFSRIPPSVVGLHTTMHWLHAYILWSFCVL